MPAAADDADDDPQAAPACAPPLLPTVATATAVVALVDDEGLLPIVPPEDIGTAPEDDAAGVDEPDVDEAGERRVVTAARTHDDAADVTASGRMDSSVTIVILDEELGCC